MSAHDPEAFRTASRERWERSSAGWGERRTVVQTAAQPVSAWLVDAIAPQPGHRVLELAAGPGDTGLMAAELIAPGGRLISTDVADGMVAAARARAEELGISNAEFKTMDAEWIDAETASLDGVLCRWGFMLMADPGAALRETRRVLKPGGRVALAAWAGPEHNVWASTAPRVLIDRGAMPPPTPGEPNMFSFAAEGHIAELLEDAGFTDVVVDEVALEFAYDDLDEWWDVQLDLSAGLYDTVAAMTPAERDDAREALDARLAPYVAEDGGVRIPGLTQVAAADA